MISQASQSVSSFRSTSRRWVLRSAMLRRNRVSVAQSRSAAAISKTSCSEAESAVRPAWLTALVTASVFSPDRANRFKLPGARRRQVELGLTGHSHAHNHW